MDPDTRLFSTRVEADPDSVPKATQGQAHGRGHRSRKEASSPGHNSSGPILPAAEARGNLNTTSRGQRWLQKYSGKGTDNGWGGLFSLGSLSPTPSGAWMAFPTPHASLAPGEPPNSAPAGYLCPPMPPPIPQPLSLHIPCCPVPAWATPAPDLRYISLGLAVPPLGGPDLCTLLAGALGPSMSAT